MKIYISYKILNNQEFYNKFPKGLVSNIALALDNFYIRKIFNNKLVTE